MTARNVKFPNVTVKLSGTDGNAFAIMGKVVAALKKAGATKADTDAYFAEATKGSYDQLLSTTMQWVNVE